MHLLTLLLQGLLVLSMAVLLELVARDLLLWSPMHTTARVVVVDGYAPALGFRVQINSNDAPENIPSRTLR